MREGWTKCEKCERVLDALDFNRILGILVISHPFVSNVDAHSCNHCVSIVRVES